jgi:ABC-type bacteriocin/lantibiotic exporter with double-glycine peptidase domain
MNFLLSISGRKALLKLFFCSFLILIFDLTGIALIFPFLNLFIAPDLILDNEFAKKIYHLLGFENTTEFIYAIGAALMFMYFLKLILKIILNRIKFSTLTDITYRLSSNLFKGLLESRYSLFTETSASEMVTVINAQTTSNTLCLDSIIKLIIELILIIIVICIAFYFNPTLTLGAISLFTIVGAVLYFGLVKKIVIFGKIHTKLNVLIYKYGYVMANSIKDIKIMRLESNYIARFSQIWHEYSQNDGRSKIIKAIPSDLTEFLIFSSVVLVCFYLLVTKQDVQNMLPVLGVLALTAMRILPSFNRIISSYNDFRYYKPSILLVEQMYEKIIANHQEIEDLKLDFKESLFVRGLSFTYGDQKVLDSVSLELKKGGSYAFVGSSGAGKSTLLDVLVGLSESASGTFYLDGVQFDPFKTNALRSYCGYVPQSVNLIDDSIAFNISFNENYDMDRMNYVISAACLDQFVLDQQDGLETLIGESGIRVSGGQKQRIGIARALYCDPEILIFDEATSALDAITERELMKKFVRLTGNKTLIIVAHRLSTVKDCTKIHLLDNGKITARGNHQDLLSSSPKYQLLYNEQEKNDYKENN